jgi:hypothetical protein
MNPFFFKLLLNTYPPYLGTGIMVRKIKPDFTEIIVEMKLRWYNRNYVRTHFGGSLYAMVDPFFMLMLMQILGKEYIVWDKSAAIDFLRPGRGTVTATFAISREQIADIHAHTIGGEKYLPKYTVDIRDEAGEKVARVVKTIYIKKKARKITSN